MSTYLGYKHIGGKVEVTMYNFIKCIYRTLNITYDSQG